MIQISQIFLFNLNFEKPQINRTFLVEDARGLKPFLVEDATGLKPFLVEDATGLKPDIV